MTVAPELSENEAVEQGMKLTGPVSCRTVKILVSLSVSPLVWGTVRVRR